MTPRITCREIHTQLAAHLPGDGKVLSVELGDHIAHCYACRRFVTAQEEMAKDLCLVRESVGKIPESLDTAVLAAFRRHVATGKRARVRPSISPAWRWSVAAAVVLVSIALFFASRKPVSVAKATPVTRPAAKLLADAETKNALTMRPAKSAITAVKHMHFVRPANSSVPPERAVRSIPQEFRSLMYCDELSCPGDMELIHVQLPSSFVARAGAWTRGNFVNAEVIVGPDGIARGIRLEE